LNHSNYDNIIIVKLYLFAQVFQLNNICSESLTESEAKLFFSAFSAMGKGNGGRSSGMCCLRFSLIAFNLVTLVSFFYRKQNDELIVYFLLHLVCIKDFCLRFTRFVLFILFQLASVSTFCIGVWLFRQSQEVNPTGPEILEELSHKNGIPNNGQYKGFSILLMCLGFMSGLVSFMGCFGACVKSRCLLLSVSNLNAKVSVNQLCIFGE